MPAIRDWSWTYTTTTSGTTITPPMPDFVQNDLLLAILSADTGTGTWSSSGWTQLFSVANTTQLTVMYKIAGSSESDPTFTRTSSETFNCSLISVRDIDTTNPFGSTPTYTTHNHSGSYKFSMQTISTTVDNSLVLYVVSNTTASIPSLIEGPVTLLYGADGSAHADGVGWGFQPTSGTTPSNVVCSNTASVTGVDATIQIAAPSGGATVIPVYCTADSSTYINPINGVTAFNGDTALAATADTGFGTSLGGKTADDATTAAAADVGLNSFHSVGRLTTTSATKNMSGAELVLATGNKPDVTGKNILVHNGPSTAGQIQRFSGIASGRGIWAGMRSGSATDYKIWQVRGVDSPEYTARDLPLVINEAAGNTKATAGTLDPSSIAAFGFWVSGIGVSTTIWDFYSLWMLDTVTIAGGNSSEPLNIAGMRLAGSNGHERRSIIQQGANQALILGPVQFGDGGTNPLYMDFNDTALEFPKQYDADAKLVSYNSIDNVTGITYYAGSGDTIKHRNSLVSSASKYHWGFNEGSSSSATYDFSGLTVIGAGTVTLVSDIHLSDIVWSNCDGFLASGTYLDNCSIVSSNSTTALTVTSTTEMERISNCSFINNTNGHSIEITATGTYTFDNIDFSGGGAQGSSTADVYNNSGGLVTINVTNGGTTPTIRNGTNASTTVNNTVYLTVTVVDSTNYPVENAQTAIYKSSDNTQLMNMDTETVTAGNFVVGTKYIILSVGTTDFTAVGAASNTVGEVFTATGVGSGNGTASNGTAKTTFNYSSDTDIYIRVRKSSTGSTKYYPASTTGTISSSGFSATITLIEDTTA